jgi:hypothetical protein
VSTSYAGYNYIVHEDSATGRSEKDVVYLQTLAESGRLIRALLKSEDSTDAGIWFADRITLKRVITGCEWTIQQTDLVKRKAMQAFMLDWFDGEVYRQIHSHRFAAWLCRLSVHRGCSVSFSRIARIFLRNKIMVERKEKECNPE